MSLQRIRHFEGWIKLILIECSDEVLFFLSQGALFIVRDFLCILNL